tara:strand:+ start:38 stop:1474 length:1437 start_codon:yes stop_codon:yes gene_type:complete
MSNSTYLGQKGYSIYKDSINFKDINWIKNELLVRPYIPKSPVQPEAFPIYLESPKKIYIPRFFGIEHFGEPEEIKIKNGENINIKFNGTLRDYQINVVNAYKNCLNNNGGGGLLELPCGYGKTIIALNIISELKTKTLVIVHKGFLVNQWIERIEEFLPNARIGKIQGQIIDIEDKDIVIGMLQSLSMKEYPDEMYNSFGLTIVDECHHISSEVFSRCLKKIVTKNMLGLSATMQRKDGLTKVFKMYLGEIVYKAKRDTHDKVLVKAINYTTSDENFNKVILDFRGNTAQSKMISKLCEYNQRSDFIIKVLKKELEEKNDQQIMVLGQNKNLLIYIHNAVKEQDIASVGFYIGGMKDADLKVSETKKIIVATYAMASEGLDIKTLSTLFLVSPRTDVVQAVGRILRVKHERPLVIDLIDPHQNFINQWNKRRAFYKKNKYKIIMTDNKEYFNNCWSINNDSDTKVINEKKIKKCLITI